MEESMDEYCEKIFVIISFHEEEVRFNELHRELTKNGVKMSTPTLIQHLKHLVEKGIIQREEKDKQNVTYKINWKEYVEVKEVKKHIEKMSKSEKNFKSDSLYNQVIYTTGMLFLGELYFTKLTILDIIEPENKLQHYVSYNLIRKLSSFYYTWLLDSCKGSEENRKKALEIIEKRIKEIQKALVG